MSTNYLTKAVSNGNVTEQAIIRRWWHETFDRRGVLVWEYHLKPKWADAVVFLELTPGGREEPGRKTARRFPLSGARIVLCEAKTKFDATLLGQALLHRECARRHGAIIEDTYVFATTGSDEIQAAARSAGLKPVIGPL